MCPHDAYGFPVPTEGCTLDPLIVICPKFADGTKIDSNCRQTVNVLPNNPSRMPSVLAARAMGQYYQVFGERSGVYNGASSTTTPTSESISLTHTIGIYSQWGVLGI